MGRVTITDQITAEAMRAELVRLGPIIKAAYELERACIENNPLSVASALAALQAARRVVYASHVPHAPAFKLWVVGLAAKVGPKVAAQLAGIVPKTLAQWVRRAGAIEGSVSPLVLRWVKRRSKASRIEARRAVEQAKAEIATLTYPHA